jgi:23S rRNA pseudouridine2457 synthase
VSRILKYQRITLLLRSAGFGSQKVCERLIRAGRVHRNGQPVGDPQGRAEPARDQIAIDGVPDEAALEALRKGVVVKGEATRPAVAELLTGGEMRDIPSRSEPIRYRVSIPTAWLRIVLTEGRKRQVRHMTAAVGYPTLRLIRIAIGPVELGHLEPGEWRDLDERELRALAATLG